MELKNTMGGEFEGVFRFTNNSDQDFNVLWNNKEYTFPAKTTSPMIVLGESLENIQEIRKKFALKWAQREFFKTKEFAKMEKTGGITPATYSNTILEPFIEQCLKPLPTAKAVVKDMPKDSENNYSSKAISDKQDPNFEFKDAPVETKGVMPE